MSSASTPPSRKNAKVRTRYMIPMRLWSVVVTQLVQPVRCGATEWAATWGRCVVVHGGAVVVARGRGGCCVLRVAAGRDGRARGGGGGVGRLDVGLPAGQ